MMSIEEIIKVLEHAGIKAERKELGSSVFERLITFKIYDTDYRIIWYANEATLKIGLEDRCPQITFRYIFYNTTFPIIGGNKSIVFSYFIKKKESMFDSEYSHHIFRIPTELKPK